MAEEVAPDFEDHSGAGASAAGAKKKGSPAKTAKSTRKSSPTKPRVNPAKMELDGSDEEEIDLFDGGDQGAARELKKLKQSYENLLGRLAEREKEADTLMRDNELLYKEINEIQRRVEAKDPEGEGEPEDEMMDVTLGGRPVVAAAAETVEEFERVHRGFTAEEARAAVSAQSCGSKLSRFLARLRASRRHKKIPSNRSLLDYGKALMESARLTQLHVKLGQPGVPFTEKQCIGVATRGDAPGLAHLAVLSLARTVMLEGLNLVKDLQEQDARLGLDCALAYAEESDNILALLGQGLSEDVLFFEDVSPVAEYQYLIDQINNGRAVEELLTDARVERMLQIVRSQGRQTRQNVSLPSPVIFDENGRPFPSQNDVIFGVTAGYAPESAGKDGGAGTSTSQDIKYCHFFQKKSGCFKGKKCKFVKGHICSKCGSRSHGASKHAASARYAPYA